MIDMTEMLEFFIAKLGFFISWLNTLQIVEGVSLLGFLAAIFILVLIIHNLLFRAQG